MDWTFDLFMEDSRLYTAENPDDTSNYRAYFMGWFKRAARKFEADWRKKHSEQTIPRQTKQILNDSIRPVAITGGGIFYAGQ